MEECENLQKCPIFSKFGSDGIKNIWIRFYCRGPNQEDCARMKLKGANKKVPPTLLPDGQHMESLDVSEADQINKRQRKIFFFFSVLIIPAGIVWATIYYIFNAHVTALFPAFYSMVSSIFFIIYLTTGHYRTFIFLQLLMMLILPYLVHTSLGGFNASSGVIIWSFVTPLGGFLCYGRKGGMLWFIAFIFIVILSSIFNPFPNNQGVELPQNITLIFSIMNIIIPMAIVYFVLDYFIRILAEKHQQVIEEQARAEKLLLNILPFPIAIRLKNKSETIAEGYKDVTVLFADLVGFTMLSSDKSPVEVVSMLNRFFSMFDEITDRHGVEKIKTIGDAYMAVSGVPIAFEEHAERMADVALEMLKSLENQTGEENYSKIRIGINSGPVVAGVIGQKKFIYDLWGDTVNIANRMESCGLEGKICISKSTYELLKNNYIIEKIGDVNIKGKGLMCMYWLVGKKPSNEV